MNHEIFKEFQNNGYLNGKASAQRQVAESLMEKAKLAFVEGFDDKAKLFRETAVDFFDEAEKSDELCRKNQHKINALLEKLEKELVEV